MEAKARSLLFLTNEDLVEIPFFQRKYVWNEKNWEDLITDLLKTDKSHFLGSLILKQVDVQTGNNKKVLVIDGQQRLTTLSVLLRALINSFDEELQKKCLQDPKFNNCLFYKKDAFSDELLVKIKHSKVDRYFYEQVINNEIDASDIDLEKCENNILKCYKYFTNIFKEVSEEARKQLFNDLLNQNNNILVIIDLTEKDNEQSIFDTINSAGVRLSSADTIKNYLFQKAFSFYEKQQEVEELYKEYWENVFTSDEKTITFWDTQRVTGRLLRDNIEILLHCISVIEGYFNPEKDNLPDLSNVYKTYIDKMDKTELTNLIKTISEYAKLYREKFFVFDKSDLFDYDEHHRRLFHILSVSEVTTFHPYILYLYRKYSDNDIKLSEELKKLEVFIIRRFICNSGTKNYNKLCKDFIIDSSKLISMLDETNDDNIKNALMRIPNYHATLILFWIELYRRKVDNKYDREDLKYNYSLEHIMPQKWEEYWSDIPVTDDTGNIISDPDKAKEYRYNIILSIGNMTLLKSYLNSSIKNYEFKRKVEGEGRKRGIKHYAELGITKFDILEPYEKGDTSWDEAKIRTRTEQIYRDILKIWSIN